MPAAFFVVRATVADPAKRKAFDEWYRREHLPDAVKAFGVEKAWRPGRGRSHHEWRSAEAAGRRMEPPLARGHAHARDFCAGGGIWRGVRARVIPGHRAAMNPESGADVAGDSGFALTRAPE